MVDGFRITGKTPLNGVIKVSGAKNAALPIIIATLVAKGEYILKNVPNLRDIRVTMKLLEDLGMKTEKLDNNTYKIINNGFKRTEASYQIVKQMRASFLVMGPMIANLDEAVVSLPGGCAIGSRPVDLHLKGFEMLGADITRVHGYVHAKSDNLKGAEIPLGFPSVGATQNIMMAATLAQGTTVIENAAREPEIVDLALLLNKMGAKVRGAGTENITIIGVEKLHGAEHNVVQDRIEAGTFMVAAAMTGGDLLIEDAIWEHNRPLLSKMQEMGVEVTEEDEGIRVRSDVSKLKAVSVKTLPYPGFPTDMQAQFTALMAIAQGESVMVETVFENRFQHLEEMRRMGLHSDIMRDTARIWGGGSLQGAEVMSTDLRASATLILMGLIAEGETKVSKLVHLDRGYYKFHEKLAALGANVKRVKEEDDE